MHIKLHSICLPFLIFCLLILHRHLSLLLSSSGCLWVCEWNLFLKIEKLHFCVALDTPSFLLLLGVSCSYFWILPFSGYSVCLNQLHENWLLLDTPIFLWWPLCSRDSFIPLLSLGIKWRIEGLFFLKTFATFCWYYNFLLVLSFGLQLIIWDRLYYCVFAFL